MAKKAPNRAPTHSPIEVSKLMKYAGELEDIANDGKVVEAELIELAEDNGVAAELYYAALPIADLEIESEAKQQFVVCVGGCQGWGALECIERLVDERDDPSSFAIVPRDCLDRCEHAAVVEVRSTDGTAVLTAATAESVSEAAAAVSE